MHSEFPPNGGRLVNRTTYALVKMRTFCRREAAGTTAPSLCPEPGFCTFLHHPGLGQPRNLLNCGFGNSRARLVRRCFKSVHQCSSSFINFWRCDAFWRTFWIRFVSTTASRITVCQAHLGRSGVQAPLWTWWF